MNDKIVNKILLMKGNSGKLKSQSKFMYFLYIYYR